MKMHGESIFLQNNIAHFDFLTRHNEIIASYT